jgi:hypothetical protein
MRGRRNHYVFPFHRRSHGGSQGRRVALRPGERHRGSRHGPELGEPGRRDSHFHEGRKFRRRLRCGSQHAIGQSGSCAGMRYSYPRWSDSPTPEPQQHIRRGGRDRDRSDRRKLHHAQWDHNQVPVLHSPLDAYGVDNKVEICFVESLTQSRGRQYKVPKNPNKTTLLSEWSSALPADALPQIYLLGVRRAGSDQTESERPRRKARKQRPKTEWLRLAPKYCQKAAAEPG